MGGKFSRNRSTAQPAPVAAAPGTQVVPQVGNAAIATNTAASTTTAAAPISTVAPVAAAPVAATTATTTTTGTGGVVTASAATSPMPAGAAAGQPLSPVMPLNTSTRGTAITPPLLNSPGGQVATIDRSPAPAFAAIRNSHDAMRKAIERMQLLVDAGNISEFTTCWREYTRALRVHVALEDNDLFSLLDGVSDGAVTKNGIVAEHTEDLGLVAAVENELAQPQPAPKAPFDNWSSHQLAHLQHEEDTILPLTLRTAPTFEERAAVVHQRIINPAFARDEAEFVWYSSWVVKMLSTYGTTATAPSPATRVYIGATQAATTPSQYRILLAAYRNSCNPIVWEEICRDYNIEGPGLQPEPPAATTTTTTSTAPAPAPLPPVQQSDYGLAQPPPKESLSPRSMAFKYGYKAPYPAAENYPHFRSGYSYVLPMQPMTFQTPQQTPQPSQYLPVVVGSQQSFHPEYNYVIGYNQQQ